MSHIVTKEWIDKYTTRKATSAITAPQAKILGFTEWTQLKKGWRDKVIGIEISNASKELFELLCGVVGKANQAIVINDFKKKISRYK